MGQGNPIDRRATLRGIGIAAGTLGGALMLGRGTSNAAAAGGWATGGTAAMREAASYPDPFALGGRACELTCEQILGPCWAPQAPLRRDISEGEPGIPMRMALRLLEARTCTPIAGAEVEVWHTNHGGLYSGADVEAGAFCTSGSDYAEARYFHRGRAIADADGVAIFDSCFPGWYGSRALHVHLLVRMPDHVGEANTRNLQTVTQLYFPEDLTRAIHQSVAGYAERGQPDTSNSTDMVLRRAGAENFMFGIEQMTDGAMVASKTVHVGLGESCGSRGFGGGFGRS